jgi:hypothetical protein
MVQNARRQNVRSTAYCACEVATRYFIIDRVGLDSFT